MLAFSRKQDLSMRAVEVNGVIGQMQDLLERTLGPAVRIRLELDHGLWLAMADPVQLEVLLLNLAVNARDAMPMGGELRFATRNANLDAPEDAALSPGEYVVLSVSDTGEGMSDDVRSKAFEPFFTTKGPGKGTGLGLAQVFGFARQAGGTVVLDSVPGAGTTVSVYLPRSLLPLKAVEDASESPPPNPIPGRLNVLLVDDDDAVR
ncbi:MAG: hypothetical protein HIU82_22015, partial [Proteobacteria bacterium]|nr:hypothetical protein [Pseudomonadota bacterium]